MTLINFFIKKDLEYIKKNSVYFAIFIFSEVMISYLLIFESNYYSIFGEIIGYSGDFNSNYLVTINALFVFWSIVFLVLKSNFFLYQLFTSCFIGRLNERKLLLYIFINSLIMLIFINFLLVIISFIYYLLFDISIDVNYKKLIFNLLLEYFIIYAFFVILRIRKSI